MIGLSFYKKTNSIKLSKDTLKVCNNEIKLLVTNEISFSRNIGKNN